MRSLIESFDAQFVKLHRRSCEFIAKVPAEKIYWQPRETRNALPVYSCGEYLLRSAGAVEQTAGGLTTKLWDDPFEWTLPEALYNNEKVLEYLGEVEETRARAFGLLQDDADLHRELPAPEKLRTIFTLLLDTLSRAENYQGRAFAVFSGFSDEKIPRL
jgi:hypothetical protein